MKTTPRRLQRAAPLSLPICRTAILPLVRTLQFMILSLSSTMVVAAQSDTTISLIVQQQDNRVRGPVRITLTDVNTLRYDLAMSVAGQTLATPKFPTQTVTSLSAFQQIFPHELLALQDESAGFSKDSLDNVFEAFETVQIQINDLLQSIDQTNSYLDSVLRLSDATLRSVGGKRVLLNQLKTLQQSLSVIAEASWPFVEVQRIAVTLSAIGHAFATATAEDSVSWDTAVMSAMVTHLGKLLEPGGHYAVAADSFAVGQSRLRYWKLIVDNILSTPDSAFALRLPVFSCPDWLGTRRYTISMRKTDRLYPDRAPSSQEIVIVECPERLSVTAGFGFSFGKHSTYIVEPSRGETDGSDPAPTVRRFAKAEARLEPLPIALLNARLGTSDVAISVGVAADVGNEDTGNDLEYLVGMSWEIPSARIWMSSLFHLKRTADLGGDFSVGEVVPASITDPPLRPSWSPAFVLAWTYQR